MKYHYNFSYVTNKVLRTNPSTTNPASWIMVHNQFYNLQDTAVRISSTTHDKYVTGTVVINYTSFTNCSTTGRYVGFETKSEFVKFCGVTFVDISARGNPTINVSAKTTLNASQCYVYNVTTWNNRSSSGVVNKDMMTFISQGDSTVSDINVSKCYQTGSYDNIAGAWLKLHGSWEGGSVVHGTFKYYLEYNCSGDFLLGATHMLEESNNKVYCRMENIYVVNSLANSELIYSRSLDNYAEITMKDVYFVNCSAYYFISQRSLELITKLHFILENVFYDKAPVTGTSTVMDKFNGTFQSQSPITYPAMGSISIRPETLTANLADFVAKGITLRSVLFGIFTPVVISDFMDNIKLASIEGFETSSIGTISSIGESAQPST